MEDVNIGDVFIVSEYPRPFSSRLSPNCPVALTYPTKIEIVEIAEDISYIQEPHLKGYHRESDTYYGFWWGSLKKVAIKIDTIYISHNLIKFLTQHDKGS